MIPPSFKCKVLSLNVKIQDVVDLVRNGFIEETFLRHGLEITQIELME